VSSTSPLALETAFEQQAAIQREPIPRQTAADIAPAAPSDDPDPPGSAILIDAPPRGPPSLARDLLRGAAEISVFIFGTTDERAKVYHLVSVVKAEDRLPVFRLGQILCARKSTLLAWIAAREVGNRQAPSVEPAPGRAPPHRAPPKRAR